MNDFTKWKQLSIELKRLKQKEYNLRKQLCNLLFEKNTVPYITDGIRYKAVYSTIYSLDIPVLNQIWNKLTPQEQQAIEWKPSLSMTKYKDLPENSLLREAVIEKEGAPKLEWKELK